MTLTILIPAAGAATRMRGGDKLLEEVDGHAQLVRAAQAALGTGQNVLITLGPRHGARRAVLPEHPRLAVTAVPDAATGMAASLRAAARYMPGPLMIFPADMPDLNTDDLQSVIRHFSCNPEAPARGVSAQGIDGHPVILPAHMKRNLTALKGDEGARSLLTGTDITRVPLSGDRAITDLDTPEAWAAWRAARGKS